MYAAVRPCRADDWLDVLEQALGLPGVEALRRRLHVAGRDTVLRAAGQWAAASHEATGRDVAVSHATVGAAIGYQPATVKRICRFLARLGFLVEIVRGRDRLTLAELDQARRQGGTQQRAAASTRALTIPQAVEGTPLPVPRSGNGLTQVPKKSPRRARRRAAARPELRTETTRRAGRGGPRQMAPPRPLPLQKLAAALAARMPWLARGRHIGHLCDMLTRAGIDPARWTAGTLLRVLDQHTQDAGIRTPDPGTQHDPLAWLAWLIRHAIDPTTPTPLETAQARRQATVAESARRRAEAAALRARVEADGAEIDRIIAAMRAGRRRAR